MKIWTEQEWTLTIERARTLRAADPSLRQVELFKRAQEALPADRRRPAHAQGVSKFTKRVRAADIPWTKPAPAAPAPVVVIDDAPPPQSLADALIEAGAELVAGILSHESVREALRGLVAVAVGREHVAQVEGAPWSTRTSLPRIVVAGLKGSQLTEIQRELGDRADLRFWRSGQSTHQLRALSDEADAVVGMTGFISHSADAVMKSRAKRYVRCPGGISMLKGCLKELAPRP